MQIKQDVALDDEEGGVITNGFVDTEWGGFTFTEPPLQRNGDFRKHYLLFCHTERWGETAFEVSHDRVRLYSGISSYANERGAILDGSLVWAVDNEFQIEICFEANGREYTVHVLKELFFPGELGQRKPVEMCLVRKGFTTMPNDDAYIPA